MNSEAVILSHPPVLVTLVTGLMIAFALQLLLTSFGVAAGVTAVGYLPNSQTENSPAENRQPDSEQPDSEEPGQPERPGKTIGRVGFALGAGTLLTVNTVLFAACFLAVKLSLVSDVLLGALLGVVIWSGYFLVIAWVSSKTAGSVIGAIANTLTAGMQELMSTVMTALTRKQNDVPIAIRNQLAATQSAVSTIQKQLDATPDRNNVQEIIRDYLTQLQPPKPDVAAIRREVARVLKSSELQSYRNRLPLEHVDRQSLLELVRHRTDFSQQDINQVVNALESTWQEVLGEPDEIANLNQFLSSASPDQLSSDAINQRIQQLLNKTNPEIGQSEMEQSIGLAQIQQVDLKRLGKRLLRTVLQRVDLSDLDIGRILHQIQSLTGSSLVDDRDASPFTPIKADVEDYLLNTYPWSLTRKTVKAEFKDVIYDPEANPQVVREQLVPLNRDYFVALLEQRDDLTASKIKKIVDRLEEVQQEVLATLQTAAAAANFKAFTTQVAEYLLTAKPTVKPTALKKTIQSWLKQGGLTLDQQRDRLHHLTSETILKMLQERQDLSPKQLEQLVKQIKTVRDQLLAEVDDLQEQIQAEANALWPKLEEYVKDQSQKLTARNIQRQLKTILKESKTDFATLQTHLPKFDAKAVKNWLRDRSDLSEKRSRQVAEHLEKTWNSLVKVPNVKAPSDLNNAKANSDRAIAALRDYLQQTDWSTLSLTDLPNHLLNYLQQHQVELPILGQLASTKWGSLFESLSQRADLTEHQRQQIVRQMQQTIYTLAKFPRRLALRTQSKAQTLQEIFAEYLQQADREDLDMGQIQQSITQLLSDIPAKVTSGNPSSNHAASSGTAFDHPLSNLLSISPIEILRSNFPHLKRENLVALLSERGDLTTAEVHQLVDQLEAVLQQASEQVQRVQQQIQQTIAATLSKLGDYLITLELPDFEQLDYDRIQQDLQQLLVGSQEDLEAVGEGSIGDRLRDRLSVLNQDTLATLLRARDDISASFSHQLIDQVDAVRLNILKQVELLQLQTKQQMDNLKRQAQQQAEETRKVIAIAAWWLFGTALTSMASSAIAGALAVGGFDLIRL